MVALGIATVYAEHEFRSRLEAKWASFFDTIGWRWTYEPVDAEGYIPDFLIQGERPFFVEVGPCVTAEDYRRKAAKAARNIQNLRQDILVLGVDWRAPGSDKRLPAAGWLGEIETPVWGDDTVEVTFGPGIWAFCPECRQLGVYHESMSRQLRPCGHVRPQALSWALESILRHAWADATNTAQWKP